MGKRPLLVALVIVAAGLLLQHYRQSLQSVPAYDGVEKSLECQVEDISGQGETLSVTARDVTEHKKFFCSRIKLYSGEDRTLFSNLKVGNIILIQGKLYSFSEPGNPGQFNEAQYYREQGIDYRFLVQSLTITNQNYNKRKQWLQQWKNRFLHKLEKCLPEGDAGIMAAMLLGEKSGLTEEIKELYQKNGIAHILAISGLHITMLGTGIFFFLRKFLLPMKGAAALSGILLILYGEFTGFPIATQRAVGMLLCLLLAKVVGRRYDAMNALALSGCIQLFFQPGSLFQSGFWLSYGTVFGILLFTEPFRDMKKRGNRLWEAVSGSLAIQLVTLPILLYSYYEFPLYSIFINLIILPFVCFLIGLSAAGIGISFFSLSLGRFLFGTVHFILKYYQLICYKAEKLPLHQIVTGSPFFWQILLYYVFLLIWRRFQKKEKKRNYSWLLIAAVLLLLFPFRGNRELSITNLDVGQGDCTCIRFKQTVILVDGGSSDVERIGKYRIHKFLKYNGINTVDMVFLSHSDSDHTNGILEMIEESGRSGPVIKTIVLPDIKKQDENYRMLERKCRQSGIQIKKMERGDRISIGQLSLRCLHPNRSYEWQSENDYSLVLSVEYGKFRGLLTGDLEEAGEETIKDLLSKVDYLKVGHHGSKSSSSEYFLQKLQPKIAVISAGKKNRYGHPAKEVLDRLKKAGSQIYSTIENGAVTVHSDGKKTTVSTYK